jgi:hypothetical protein
MDAMYVGGDMNCTILSLLCLHPGAVAGCRQQRPAIDDMADLCIALEAVSLPKGAFSQR